MPSNATRNQRLTDIEFLLSRRFANAYDVTPMCAEIEGIALSKTRSTGAFCDFDIDHW